MCAVFIFFVLLVLDRATKYLALSNLDAMPKNHVQAFLPLGLHFNIEIKFSLLKNLGNNGNGGMDVAVKQMIWKEYINE
jgi:lipoprotein signal peptidase